MADRIIKPDSGNQLVLQDEGGSDALRIDTSGQIGLGITPADKLHVDGNIRLTSGSGINFSAYATSGNPSSNLLDDYEEGTWTPVPTSTGATFDTNASGVYTKIGNTVFFQLILDNNSSPTGTLTNAMSIAGLPFTSGSTTGHVCSIGYVIRIDWPATAKQLTARIAGSAASISLAWAIDDGVQLDMKAQEFDFNDARINISGFYTV